MLFEALVASARVNDIEELCFAVQPTNESVRRILAGVEAHLEEVGGLMEGRIEVASVPATERDHLFAGLLAEHRARG